MASGQTWLLVAAGENWQIELVEAVKAEVKSRKLKKLSLMITTSRFFSVSKSQGNEKKIFENGPTDKLFTSEAISRNFRFNSEVCVINIEKLLLKLTILSINSGNITIHCNYCDLLRLTFCFTEVLLRKGHLLLAHLEMLLWCLTQTPSLRL